uniref:Uncharacterized protein n=1 Tax=Acrobeloides nanus TaxID=290746 RepID=A0A914DFQ7_9BILA
MSQPSKKWVPSGRPYCMHSNGETFINVRFLNPRDNVSLYVRHLAECHCPVICNGKESAINPTSQPSSSRQSVPLKVNACQIEHFETVNNTERVSGDDEDDSSDTKTTSICNCLECLKADNASDSNYDTKNDEDNDNGTIEKSRDESLNGGSTGTAMTFWVETPWDDTLSMATSSNNAMTGLDGDIFSQVSTATSYAHLNVHKDESRNHRHWIFSLLAWTRGLVSFFIDGVMSKLKWNKLEELIMNKKTL